MPWFSPGPEGSMVARTDLQLLIADDDLGFRETVVEAVESHFVTIAVESGERAIEVAGSQAIDVVLIDMHMHLLTGLDTIRILREVVGPLPWILMSSEVNDALEAAAYDLDVYRVLRKPPSRKLLLDTIADALQL